MVRYKHIKLSYLVFVSLFAAILLLPLLTLGYQNSSPEERSKFCINCHAMEAEYDAWMHSAHRRKMCVDCHLPNKNRVVYYLWKSIDGLKDVAVFYSGRVPDRIKISSHGEKVLQANCIRCHETAVMLIDTKRKCWNCHRRIAHMHTGTRETF